MQGELLYAGAVLLSVTMLCLAAGSSTGLAKTGTTEILQIVVGKPTLLSPVIMQNSASLSASRTGVLAAFYPKPGNEADSPTAPHWYRTSTDGGVTWGPEMNSPPLLSGGTAGAILRDGGVLKFLCTDDKSVGEREFQLSPMAGEYQAGWFTLHSTFAWFNDDFTDYEVAPVSVYMPDAVTVKHSQFGTSYWPIFPDGKMIQLPNGDLLVSAQGAFKGDIRSRVTLCRSSDGGHTWRHYATVAVDPQDPNPELPGQYVGYTEPSIELLPNGRMICVMRTQYSHMHGEYRPIYVSWSDDLGKTWTKPEPTTPHLMNIIPHLVALDNGVLACEYGRPGFHVVFSLDNGHTWQDRISFSDLPVTKITGQFDMIKAGPNRLVAIGNDAEGTKVWPITVERVKAKSSRTKLTGHVLDEQGNPIAGAKVELGPNRYTADCWVEGEELNDWKTERKLVAPPVLGYLSISETTNSPVAQTDKRGWFEFKEVRLLEYVLTVEAAGYAPKWRHIKVGEDRQSQTQSFRLTAGKALGGRVVDQTGDAVGGACVVLDRLHIHTDPAGFFHAAIEAPVPDEVTVKLYKRYHGRYETGGFAHGTFIDYDMFQGVQAYPLIREEKLPLSRLESEPLVMQCTKVYSW